LEQVKAVRVGLDNRAFLLRTELTGRAYDAFQALGLRSPSRLQSLSTSSRLKKSVVVERLLP
jgi:hypothetical protein